MKNKILRACIYYLYMIISRRLMFCFVCFLFLFFCFFVVVFFLGGVFLLLFCFLFFVNQPSERCWNVMEPIRK